MKYILSLAALKLNYFSPKNIYIYKTDKKEI